MNAADELKAQLLACCGSRLWVESVAARAPFASVADIHSAADDAFDQLHEDDWLQAFAHHPRIGDVTALRERFAASGALSESEQSGLSDADEAVIADIAAGNDSYEQRFGFVFLIRAAGRSAQEMRDIQRERLANDRDTEIAIAAQQQREITHLRIDTTFGDWHGN